MKDKGTSRKVTQDFLNFTDNVRATRRAKPINIDKKMLTQMEVGDLIVKYFKENNDSFLELIKVEVKNG
jgi:hypothetical protein